MNVKGLAAGILSVWSFKKQRKCQHPMYKSPDVTGNKEENFYTEVCRLDASTDISQQMSCRPAQTEISSYYVIIVNRAALGCTGI